MYSIDKFYQNALLLSNSLTFKIPEIGIAMNRAIQAEYPDYYISDDKRTWKYYRNLAGIPHETNSAIYITAIEDGSRILLTADNMVKYPTTRKLLCNFKGKFNELCRQYPRDNVYIRGCLNPTNIDYAINMPEGTILYYNKEYVESNEFSLIGDLEDYIKNFLHRWNIKEYILTDELYAASLIGVLSASLPNKIINIRNNYSLTSQVNSFHLEHFFRSHLELWDQVKILNNESKFWLYKNLQYMLKHIGKEKTFKLLVNNVLEANKIGIGTYDLILPDINANKINNTDASVPAFKKENNELYTVKLNESYRIEEGFNSSVPEIIQRELDILPSIFFSVSEDGIPYNKNTERDKYVIDNVSKDVYRNNINYQKTKILDMSSLKILSLRGIDPYELAMNYWGFLAFQDIFTFNVEYVDANVEDKDSISTLAAKDDNDLVLAASVPYTVNYRIAFLMMLKILFKATGQLDKKITTVHLHNIVNPDPDKINTSMTRLWDDGGISESIIRKVLKYVPTIPGKLNSVEDFTNYMLGVYDYSVKSWIADTNSENAIVQANMKLFNTVNIMPQDIILSETPKTIDEILLENGVDYILPKSFNLNSSFRGIFKRFIGIDITSRDDILENLETYKKLVNKLTSYTLQVIDSQSLEEDEQIYYNAGGPGFFTNKPLMTITNAKLCPLEHDIPWVKAYGTDMIDDTSNVDMSYPVALVFGCHKPIWGHASTIIAEKENETYVAYSDVPTMAADIIHVPNINEAECRYKDEFLFIGKATWSALEDFDGKVKGSASEMLENLDTPNVNEPMTISMDSPNSYVYEEDKNIEGHGEATTPIDETHTLVTYDTKPKTAVELSAVYNKRTGYDIEDDSIFYKEDIPFLGEETDETEIVIPAPEMPDEIKVTSLKDIDLIFKLEEGEKLIRSTFSIKFIVNGNEYPVDADVTYGGYTAQTSIYLDEAKIKTLEIEASCRTDKGNTLTVRKQLEI